MDLDIFIKTWRSNYYLLLLRLDKSKIKKKGIILPDPLPNFNKTLFLDLDETLIHSEPYEEGVE